jgi:hypothetical protein
MMLHKWIGPFGEYDVPPAIIWLASRANLKAGHSWRPEYGFHLSTYRYAIESPGWKVIEEWGKWRESEDEKEYSRACQ